MTVTDTIQSPPDPAVRSGTDRVQRELQQSVNQVVGSIFYGTLMRQLRDSTLKGAYGHGGFGEKVFQGQLHEVFAEQAGEARTFRFADTIARRLVEAQTRLERARSAKSETGSDKA